MARGKKQKSETPEDEPLAPSKKKSKPSDNKQSGNSTVLEFTDPVVRPENSPSLMYDDVKRQCSCFLYGHAKMAPEGFKETNGCKSEFEQQLYNEFHSWSVSANSYSDDKKKWGQLKKEPKILSPTNADVLIANNKIKGLTDYINTELTLEDAQNFGAIKIKHPQCLKMTEYEFGDEKISTRVTMDVNKQHYFGGGIRKVQTRNKIVKKTVNIL